MSEPSALVFPVTEQDFETKVVTKSRDVPVVVDFWAPWCGPCRALTPALERLVEQRKGEVLLAKVNTDDEPNLAMQYRINALPTVIAFRGGKPILDFEGLLPESQLVEFLDRLVPSQAEKQAADAVKLEKTDAAKAEQLYRQALASSPNEETAILGLARILLERNQDAEAGELLERVGPGGPQGAEAERLLGIVWLRAKAKDLADETTLRSKVNAEPKNAQARHDLGCRLAAAGNDREALEQLYAAGQLDRKLAGAGVRETMVKIFHVIGVRSELADEFRDKLSSLLY